MRVVFPVSSVSSSLAPPGAPRPAEDVADAFPEGSLHGEVEIRRISGADIQVSALSIHAEIEVWQRAEGGVSSEVRWRLLLNPLYIRDVHMRRSAPRPWGIGTSRSRNNASPRHWDRGIFEIESRTLPARTARRPS